MKIPLVKEPPRPGRIPRGELATLLEFGIHFTVDAGQRLTRLETSKAVRQEQEKAARSAEKAVAFPGWEAVAFQ